MSAAGERPAPYTVSSLTAALKSLIEGRFARIYVEAEISGWRRQPSGHCYFTLKDEGAQIPAVMFASAYGRCRARDALKDGAKVLVYADATVYPPRGAYQLVVLAAKPVGAGDLMQRYLELKARLEAEGLFDASRKRPLPFMPRRIGLVTSEAGAVVHDMCTVLARRFPAVEIRLWPCLVQGEGAAESVCEGLAHFAASPWRADVVIVARGGGSFEDLFCFNDERLVRAVAASEIPTISAVGHETDYTLCDFAADVRAGTPSIAAELAVPLLSDVAGRLSAAEDSLSRSLRSRGEFAAQRLDQLSASLGSALTLSLARAERRLAEMSPRMEPAVRMALERAGARLERASVKIEAYSPYGVLERGYSLTTDAGGAIVRDAAALSAGDTIVTRFGRGSVRSTVSGR